MTIRATHPLSVTLPVSTGSGVIGIGIGVRAVSMVPVASFGVAAAAF